MATVRERHPVWKNDYPTSDGKPMAETEWHRDLMLALIETLKRHFADQPRVYASGNMLLFYERGNKRKHVSPDVFVVRGVHKEYKRPNYLVWEEGHAPHVVIEITSKTTRSEDVKKKYELYRDTLKVKEYFLFDPDGDYLDPALQGHRLIKEEYRPIRPVQGRLPSQVLGLHLEGDRRDLRLYDPATGQWLATPEEHTRQAEERAEQAEERAEQAEERAEQAEGRAERAEGRAERAEGRAEQERAARRQLEAELERLRRERAQPRQRRNGE